MQLKVGTFTGLRPLIDDQTPTNSLAQVAHDCYLRRRALHPRKSPVPTEHTVYANAARLHYDARRSAYFGGSLTSGVATETFPDSELLYVFDGINSRVLDGTGSSLPITPVPPAELNTSASTLFRVIDQGNDSAQLNAPERGANLAVQMQLQADTDRPTSAGVFEALDLLKAEAAAANPADGWWSFDEVNSAMINTYLKAKTQARIFRIYSDGFSGRSLQPLSTMEEWASYDTLDEIIRQRGMNVMFKAHRSTQVTGFNPKLSVKFLSAYETTMALPQDYEPGNGGFFESDGAGGGTWTPDPFPGAPDATQMAQNNIADMWYEAVDTTLRYGASGLPPAPSPTSLDSRDFAYLSGELTGAIQLVIPITTGNLNWTFTPEYPTPVITSAATIKTTTPTTWGMPVALLQRTIEMMEYIYYYQYYLSNTTVEIGMMSSQAMVPILRSVCQSFYNRKVANVMEGTPLVPFEVGVSTLPDETRDLLRAVPVAYCYTWMDRYGRESQPSLPIVPPLPTSGLTSRHRIVIDESPPYEAQAAVVYRAVGNINAELTEMDSQFFRCRVVDVDNITQIDIPELDQSEPFMLETHEYYAVSDDATYVRESESGHLVWAAKGGTEVHFSYRHIWYATHPSRQIQLPRGWVVQGIECVSNTVYVITDHQPIIIQHGEDRGAEGLQLDVKILEHAPAGCTAPTSVCSTTWGVLYASPEALVALHGNQVSNITSSFADPDQWQDFIPNRCSAYFNGAYYGFSGTGGMILDIPDPQQSDEKDPTLVTHSVLVDAALSHRGRLLILPRGDTRVHEWGTGAPVPYRYRTTTTTLNKPTWFTTLYIRGVGTAVRTILYMDGVPVMDRDVPLNQMVRIPRHARAHGLSLELQGTATVNHVTVADSGEQSDAN